MCSSDLTIGGKHVNGEVGYTYNVKTRPTGVNENTNPVTVSVTPNPATDRIHVTTPYELPNGTTRIYNVVGKLVMESSEEDISVEHLSRGMYTVVVQVGEHQYTTTMILGQE